MNRKTTLAMGAAAMTMVAAGSASSCNLVLGLDAYYDCPEDPKCPPATTSTTTNTTTSSNTGGAPPEVCAVNGVRDDKETDVDCGGGICGPCDDGKACSSVADCVNQVCTAGICTKPGCGDGVQNGEETDVDCGGPCSPCGPDLGCSMDDDCVSAQCANGTCVSICNDLAKGGKETDVDCGGPDCAPCADAKGCKAGPDCQSGVCQGAVCQKNYVWGKDLTTHPTSIALDATGRPFVASRSSVAAYDTTGAALWNVGMNGGGGVNLSSPRIAVDGADSAFVTGTFYSTITFSNPPVEQSAFAGSGGNAIFLVKFNSMGNPTWSRVYADSPNNDSNFAGDVVTDGAGNVFVACSAQQVLDLGGGPLVKFGGQSMFLAKLDTNGAHLWSKGLGATTFNTAQSLAVDSAGNVLLAGIAYGTTADFGGGPNPANGIVVVKFDPNGAYMWDARFDVPIGPTSMFLRLGADDSVFLAGDYQMTADFGGGVFTTMGGTDIFVAKLDPLGKHVWSRSFGDGQDQVVGGFAVDPGGGLVMTATSAGVIDFGGGPLTAMGGTDVFLARLDGVGQHVWSRRYGGFGNQSGWGVSADPAGHTYLTGRYEVGIDFGGGPFTTGTGFLTKLLVP